MINHIVIRDSDINVFCACIRAQNHEIKVAVLRVVKGLSSVVAADRDSSSVGGRYSR